MALRSCEHCGQEFYTEESRGWCYCDECFDEMEGEE